MNKIWLVFKYEYSRHVLRRRFILALISMPLFIAVMMIASIASSLMTIDRSPVGFVNDSSVLEGFQPNPPENGFLNMDVQFIPFETEELVKAALQKESIQAYFVLGNDYDQTAKAKLVYLRYPANNIQEQFQENIQKYLTRTEPPEVINRLSDGYHLTLMSADGSRSMGENGWINIVILFGAGLLFIVVLFTSSGYLMSALVEEKENRTMEIMVTSISTDQLMAGKVLGNLSVGLTQMAVWMITLLVAYLIGKQQFTWLENVDISIGQVVSLAAVMLPSFVLVASLMAMLGSTFTESREAQQMTGLITLPIVAPYWLATPLIMNPNGSLAIALSYFPLTAPVTMSIRTAASVVPGWQVAISSILLIISAAAAIWMSARAYRLGMLRYGKKVSLKEIFQSKVV